ncbi:deoxyribose-phosphate aldolase [Polluticoccus soli]|uniref:deoxyribose-phosphate aldolase n=1 Tax=Polluticoccus soli TaxID=3034150 RepID=UPI0023E14978|nr:deoxyribose-phosphate aldolase [Flavipsychrobacter sp. JY13-12]
MAFDIAPYIDHTVLKPTTKQADIEKLCSEAITHGFAAVCIPPYFLSLAKQLLGESNVKLATVIGFPFGYNATSAKLEEIKQAIADGADELDIVHNVLAVKAQDWQCLEAEAKVCIELAHAAGKTVKIIVESGVLTDEELVQCCELYAPLQPDFLKTSTGYAEMGATVHAVQLMRKQLPASICIKASGGIRTFKLAKQLVDAGADRLGCSASIDIVKESKELEP